MVVMLFISIAASAQVVKVSAGVKGVGVTNIMDIGLVTYGGGGGAFAGVKIANVLGIQAEAIYAYQTGTARQYTSHNRYMVTVNHEYMYLPVLMQIWCGRSMALEVGYQQAIALSGTLKKSDYTYDDTGVFDYGSFLAGLNFNLGKVVTLGFRYAYSQDYCYIYDNVPAYGHNIQVGLGFRFFTTKKRLFK